MSLQRYELSDFAWPVIAPLLPYKPPGCASGRAPGVLNGIYWRLRTGSQLTPDAQLVLSGRTPV